MDARLLHAFLLVSIAELLQDGFDGAVYLLLISRQPHGRLCSRFQKYPKSIIHLWHPISHVLTPVITRSQAHCLSHREGTGEQPKYDVELHDCSFAPVGSTEYWSTL